MASPWGFWEFNGRNGLKGLASTTETLPDGRQVLVKDPTNPAVLEDNWILHLLSTSRQARSDYDRLFPTLLPEEQDRLATLTGLNPLLSTLVEDPQAFSDAVQHREVVAGIHVSARKGVS